MIRKEALAKSRFKCMQLGIFNNKYRIRKKKVNAISKRYGSLPWNSFTSAGPWDKEFGYYGWHSKSGYKCEILRTFHMGQLNGYVLIPKGHPLYGIDMYEEETIFSTFQVHGGVTFTDYHPLNSSRWVIGFDTGHYQDLVPGIHANKWMSSELNKLLNVKYRDRDFVAKQCENLAGQLKGLGDLIHK